MDSSIEATPRAPRASFYSLGCKVNQAETRAFAEDLLRLGYRIVPFGNPADVCIVNTCSVTDQADVKSRSVLRRAARSGGDPLVVATGCYADVAPAAVRALPGVVAVVPNADKPRLAEIVHDTLRRSGRLLFPLDEGDALDARGDGDDLIQLAPGLDGTLNRTRAVLKIQDGCNHFCSFCIIPYARGRLRSRPAAEVLEEARRFAREGYREVVLAGICLGDYGDERGYPRVGSRTPLHHDPTTCCPEGRPPHDPLADLLRNLARVPGLARIRLSSIDPADVSDDLIRALGELPQACRHLHLSLQSGDEEVLRRMRRRYTAARFEELVERLYRAVADLALTCDAIVGFPGETAEQFQRTASLCERARFVKIHAFPYSPRSGTLAARWRDDVPRKEKERRVHALMDVSRRLAFDFAVRHVGEPVEVLVESRSRATGLLTGLTGNYLRAEFAGPDSLRGRLVHVLPTSAGETGVSGERLGAT